MNSLVNKNFNRTYNPSGRQNALSDVKRLLTSRDTETQKKACGYLTDVIGRCSKSSRDETLIEYLLNNDIVVFLCEATSNLDFSLFRAVLSCLRLLWRARSFFAEQHAAHATSAVLRALEHYAASGLHAAQDACLHFLCDLLHGVSSYETCPPLSYQSAYSSMQLLACLNALAPRINTNPNTILSSALVLHALVSYMPDGLTIKSSTATALAEVLNQWFGLLMGALNHATLTGDSGASEMLVVICQLGMDVLRLMKLLNHSKQKTDLVEKILADDREIGLLKQCALQMRNTIQRIMAELVAFIKENHNQILTDEYGVFIKFLLGFLYETEKKELPDFCDLLFSKGYLTMLPQIQNLRNDVTVRQVSTLVLGEMLKVLAEKYLNVDNTNTDDGRCAKDIHMGLVELQYGIEKPQNIGMQLQKNQPYSLLIYIYFYCQSSENPEEATAPLLPYLIHHILRHPKTLTPPPYIVKALWLVFAMSTISNGSLETLQERVYLEKASDRLVAMLNPEPSIYYTHNPAILLWAFTSQRISNHVRLNVLSQWLETEDSLPDELTKEPMVWKLLLTILIQSKIQKITVNCMETLHICLDEGDDKDRQDFATSLWTSLPGVLSEALIDHYNCDIDTNTCYLLDVATSLVPLELDETVCVKIAVLITTLFSKNNPEQAGELSSRHHYQYVCLKLCLNLLGLSNNQNDSRVLLTYINRAGFLPSVLTASNSSDDRVACAALQLLSYVVHYFTKNNYQPNSILEMQTDLIIKSLRRNSSSERGAFLLQLVYIVFTSGRATPLALSDNIQIQPSETQQCTALRALMFRIQLMLCCRESANQALAGWKTLSSIFKYAIVSKKDPKIVATLTSQPWTYTLIQFQLTQNVTEEFLNFTNNWLTLLTITIKRDQEAKRSQISKQSLVIKTLMSMKKSLVQEDEFTEAKQKILLIVREILELSGIRFQLT